MLARLFQDGGGGSLNAKYALSREVAEWGPPGDILSLHTACSPIRELQRQSVSEDALVCGSQKTMGRKRKNVNYRSHVS